MNDVVLKPGKEKSLLRRHPWVYATAVAQVVGRPQPGDTVRLVFGEGDSLPGFVADRYADQLVVQFLAAGVERWREPLVDALVAATGCLNVYERSDAAARERDGLAARTGVLRGRQPPAEVEIVEDGVRYGVDVVNGHKTGFYLDQRESRRLVAELAARVGPSATVLNCFSYTGGFSLAALRAGAAHAISVDSSADALAMAARNAARNGLPEAAFECRVSKVADAQKALAAEGRQFDIVVLDPPKFAPSVHHVDKAARAYKDVNLKGMKLVKPGGYLLTFSCSGAVSVDLFQKIVAGAVIDSREDFVLLERLAAGMDHPMRMTHPEGEYLKGLLLQRV